MHVAVPSVNPLNVNKIMPLFPILGIILAIAGISMVVKYADMTPAQKKKADAWARQMFGRQFTALADHQRQQVIRKMKGK